MNKFKKAAAKKTTKIDNFEEDSVENMIEMNIFEENATKEMTEIDIFKKEATEKVSKIVQEIEKNYREKFKKQFAEEDSESEWLEIRENIRKQIIEKYCDNFSQKVNRFILHVKELKLNNTHKRIKIGLTIGGVIFAVGGIIATAVAFPLAPVAAAGAIAVAGADAAAIPFISGAVVAAGGAMTSVGAGLSAWFPGRKKTEKFPFHLILPEEFGEGKIKFKTCIGQIMYPLNISHN